MALGSKDCVGNELGLEVGATDGLELGLDDGTGEWRALGLDEACWLGLEVGETLG